MKKSLRIKINKAFSIAIIVFYGLALIHSLLIYLGVFSYNPLVFWIYILIGTLLLLAQSIFKYLKIYKCLNNLNNCFKNGNIYHK